MSRHTPGPWEVAGPTNAIGRCYRIQAPDPEDSRYRRAPDIYASSLEDAQFIANAPNLEKALDFVLEQLRKAKREQSSPVY